MSGCYKFGNNSLIKNPFQIFFRSYDFRMMCDSAMKWIETHPPTWAGHDVRHGLPGLSAVLHSPSHLQTRPRKRNANATTFANYLHRFVWTMDTNVENGSANPPTEIFASRFINFLYLVRVFIAPPPTGIRLINKFEWQLENWSAQWESDKSHPDPPHVPLLISSSLGLGATLPTPGAHTAGDPFLRIACTNPLSVHSLLWSRVQSLWVN